MELHIPKIREGSYFLTLLEPRRHSERVPLAAIHGPTSRESPPEGWTTLSRPQAATASPIARCLACARSWMRRSKASLVAPWTARPALTSGWTPLLRRSGHQDASSISVWWWPQQSTSMAGGRYSGRAWAPASTAPSAGIPALTHRSRLNQHGAGDLRCPLRTAETPSPRPLPALLGRNYGRKRRSASAPMWWESFPTGLRPAISSERCWPSNTMGGLRAAGTSPSPTTIHYQDQGACK